MKNINNNKCNCKHDEINLLNIENEHDIQTKKCKTCHQDKDLNNFYKTKFGTFGRTSNCKKCIHEKQKAKNCETERKCKKCKETKDIEEFGRHANQSRRSLCKKCYEIWFSEEEKLFHKESLKKHLNQNVTSYHKHIKRRLLHGAKRRAMFDDLPFEITEDDIVIPEFCPILGIKIKTNHGQREDNSATLDKIDNTAGYTKKNSRVISWRANRLKNDGTAEEHELIAKFMKNNGAK